MTRNTGTRLGKKVRTQLTRGTLAVLAAVALTACNSATEPELSRVKVRLTDAPTDVMESAEVWISHVYLVGGGGEEPDTMEADTVDTGAGKVDLFNDPENPFAVDLLTLQDGVSTDLTEAIEVNAGDYRGLRFVVDSARVTLVEGVTFEDGTSSAVLFVPSGSQSGIKVKINDIIDADPQETTTILVDFDVEASFVVQGTAAPNGIRRVLMKPVLKEVQRDTEES